MRGELFAAVFRASGALHLASALMLEAGFGLSDQFDIEPATICQRSFFFIHTRMNFSVPVN